MYRFISTGWNCADVAVRTLESIEAQTVTDWEAHVVLDPSTDGSDQVISDWLADRDRRWRFTANTEHKNAVRNQVEGIRAMWPAPEDVIVWVDLDGDRLAHDRVLERLDAAYADPNVWLTYGSFVTDPYVPECMLAEEIPADVVQRRSYREETLTVNQHWNHLRTMKAKVFTAIPDDQFRWPNGTWYHAGADYVMMTAALELCGARHRFIDETLLIYNHSYTPTQVSSRDSSVCQEDFLRRTPLTELP